MHPALGKIDKASIKSMKNDLEIAQDAINNMEQVVGAVSSPSANTRNRVNALREKLRRITQRVESLGESGNGSDSVVEMDELDVTSSRLQELQRLNLDSEEHGARALSRLYEQRAQLEEADSTLGRLEQGVTKARSILGGMLRRALFSKAILVGVIIVLLLAIGILITFRWIVPIVRATQPPPPPPPASFQSHHE